MTVTVGGVAYTITAQQRGAGWAAAAARAGTGERFGIECASETESGAIERLTEWLIWQREHTNALEALQRAEQAYHRTLAGSAFASATEGPSAVELQKESLDRVEAARQRLDEVRARQPK
jgi:hypothetical protein